MRGKDSKIWIGKGKIKGLNWIYEILNQKK